MVLVLNLKNKKICTYTVTIRSRGNYSLQVYNPINGARKLVKNIFLFQIINTNINLINLFKISRDRFKMIKFNSFWAHALL